VLTLQVQVVEVAAPADCMSMVMMQIMLLLLVFDVRRQEHGLHIALPITVITNTIQAMWRSLCLHFAAL
jgi:hypothetical protein